MSYIDIEMKWNRPDMILIARMIIVISTLIGLCSAVAQAQLRIDITEGQVAPTPIAIANFTGPNGEVSEIGKEIAQIISEDLESSGLFEPIDSAAFIEPPKAPSIRPNFSNWTPWSWYVAS